MTFGILIDENLPPSITKLLDDFEVVRHVSECGLSARPDTEIWDYACSHSLAILTKDSDYLNFQTLTGQGRVILLAVGNLRLAELRAFVGSKREAIAEFISSSERLLILTDH